MISVIIPTFQERENMQQLLSRLALVRCSLREDLEVLVVDSCSNDGTAQVAREILGQKSLGRVIQLNGRRDLTKAVVEGIKEARGDLIGVMDADLSHPPELLIGLAAAVHLGKDMAIASRYVPGGSVDSRPRTRRLFSWLGNRLARGLVPVADAMSGYFVCKAELIRPLKLRTNGFKILLDILVLGNFERVQEIPYRFSERKHGSSKLRAHVLWKYACQLVRLFFYRISNPCRLNCSIVSVIPDASFVPERTEHLASRAVDHFHG